MKKPTNGYYVLIQKWDDGSIVLTMGPFKSINHADKVEGGLENLDEDYYTFSAWFGPDREPVEDL